MTASQDEPLLRAQARVGSLLDEKWRLESLIGLGGMAAVYQGRHRNGARGAVKILHPELARVHEVRERFLREGYAANTVDHPGAVKVLDDDFVRSGPDEGAAYLIMELLEGESVEERIHQRGLPFPVDEVLAIADDVLDVLAAAHDKGVIHRDLKPENLFLHNEGEPGRGSAEGGTRVREFGWQRVKVVDFGLARIAQGEGVTRAGMAIGTPSYMAPEQAEGRSEDIDGKSDLFGVGAIMFRLIAARKVHEANNVIELVAKMAQVPAPAIRSVRADVPEDVAWIVDRALRFDRSLRYPNARAMRADVQAAREGRPLPSIEEARARFGNEPTLAANVAIRTPRSDPPSALAPTVPERRPPKKRAVLWIPVAIVAALVAIVAVVLTRPSPSIEQPASAGSSAPTPEPVPATPTPSAAPVAPSAASEIVDAGVEQAEAAAEPEPTKSATKPTTSPPKPKGLPINKKLTTKKKK